eukprot:CAMPEP_0184497198 /NCGR_PEP_ID=MMETSP0113_2-20130426/35910_1 /TAXON_ID=91329 /ORGANISM="Norrisiella sphaerica, Strain BC52" /LENGTH=542 /DNA_ID=CAMNT_0026884189 /DNA_START=258 /DNA_END=1886 /DNA_ORIENTATION=+
MSKRDSPTPFAKLLLEYVDTRPQLNFVNVSTILLNYAKLRTNSEKYRRHVTRTRNDQGFPSIGPSAAIYLAEQVEIAPVDDINSWSLGSALYGLQAVQNTPEMRRLLEAFVPKIWGCKEQLTHLSICDALYGIRHLEDSSATDRLVEALAVQIEDCPDVFTGYSLGKSIYALRERGDTHYTRRCIRALSRRVSKCRDLDDITVSNCIWGLKGKGTSSPAHELISELSEILPQLETQFGSQTVSNTLLGLRELNETPVVKKFLQKFARCVRNSDFSVNNMQASQAFAGIRCFSRESRRDVLEAFISKILDSDSKLDHRNISAMAEVVYESQASRSILLLSTKHISAIQGMDMKLLLNLTRILSENCTTEDSVPLSFLVADQMEKMVQSMTSEDVKRFFSLLCAGNDARLVKEPLETMLLGLKKLSPDETMKFLIDICQNSKLRMEDLNLVMQEMNHHLARDPAVDETRHEQLSKLMKHHQILDEGKQSLFSKFNSYTDEEIRKSELVSRPLTLDKRNLSRRSIRRNKEPIDVHIRSSSHFSKL